MTDRPLLEQGVLEHIRGVRRHPLLVEHLGLHQLYQAAPQRQLIQDATAWSSSYANVRPRTAQLRHRLALGEPIQPRHERILERGGNGQRRQGSVSS